MAMAAIYTTATPAAAAIGLYFFVKNQYASQGTGGVRGLMTSSLEEVKKEVKSGQMPKLAPHFDGLNCFETLVGH